MTTYAAPIEVYNAVLAHIGAKQANSLTDQHAEVRVLNSIYEGHVRAKLTKHAWTWAQKTWDIEQSGQPTKDKYYEYPLPEEMLSLSRVSIKGCPIDITRKEGRSIYYPAEELNMEVTGTYRAPEGVWAADFAEAIIAGLRATLLRSLLQDFANADRQDASAERLLRQAMVRDGNQIRGEEFNNTPHMLGPHYGRTRFRHRRR